MSFKTDFDAWTKTKFLEDTKGNSDGEHIYKRDK